MTDSLEALLAAARAAAPRDRIDLRDDIAQHGDAAIEALKPWLHDEAMRWFAIRVVGRAAELGSREAGIAALREVGATVSRSQRADFERELARIGAPGIVRSGKFGPIDQEAVRSRLVEAAKRRELVFYSDLAQATGREMKGPHWAVHIGRLLGRISADEAADGRPMLSAIVVSRDTKLPGEGFFNLGQELRRVRDGEDEAAFANRQIAEVYEFWSSRGD